MKTKTACLICNKEMKMITNTHLKSHNIDISEYKIQFPEAAIVSEYLQNQRSELAKIANEPRKGIPRSQEVRDKISQNNKGKKAWNKGIPQPENQKANQSATMKAKYASGDLIHWNTGNHWSEETKSRIRETLLSKNLHMSSESMEKRYKTMEGKKIDGWILPSLRPEVIEKRRQTALNRYNRHTPHLKHITDEQYDNLLSKEWLYEQHILNKRSIENIAEELSLNGKTVGRYLHSFGIETQNNNSGAYSETYFNNDPEKKNLPGTLYIVYLSNQDERFIKIGITQRTIEERWKNEKEFIWTPILGIKGSLYSLFLIEQFILKNLIDHQYKPEIYFGGYTECFEAKVLDQIIEIVEELYKKIR